MVLFVRPQPIPHPLWPDPKILKFLKKIQIKKVKLKINIEECFILYILYNSHYKEKTRNYLARKKTAPEPPIQSKGYITLFRMRDREKDLRKISCGVR